MEKLIITAAITGAELSKKDNPALPTTPEEQGEAARLCVEAGASIVHLHVRDDSGRPSQLPAHFSRTVEAIKKQCGAKMPILQFSTGGAVGEPIEARIAPLSLKPDMASFNMGTINFGDEIFANTFPDMRELAKAFQANGVVAEYEIYDLGHLENLKKLLREKVIEPPLHLQFVLGVPGALGGDIFADLAPLVSRVPEGTQWSVAGIGRFELPLAMAAIAGGGHVRVGLEDNIYYAKGVKARDNAQLVERIASISNLYGRAVASPAEARQQLGL